MAGLEVEDDESWLYGEDKKEEQAAAEKEAETAPEIKIKEEPKDEDEDKTAENGEDKEAGEVSGDDEKEEGEGDSDDSEDDIQVTIGDIKDKFKGGYQRPVAGHKGPTKGVDVDAPGSINGVPVVEYDVSGIQPEEKPWQKPGADITDYFNYGFTEDTWIKYCQKQALMRGESGSSKFVPGSGLNRAAPHSNKENDSTGSSNTNYNIGTTIPSWRPSTHSRKTSGTIEMIGTTTRDSRRNVSRDYEAPPPGDMDMRDPMTPSSGAPITTMGPPPVNMPPPNFGVPPPGMPPGGLPPTNMPPPNMSMPPPGTAPPGFPPPQPYRQMGPPFYGGPPGGAPPGAPPYVPNYSGPPPGYGAPPPSGPPNWDNRGPGYNNSNAPPWNSNYGEGGNNQGSDSELSSSDEERGPGYNRGRNQGEMYDPFERERSESRSRDYRGSRDRDHDRDRERRHRDRSDREERHKRRKHDDDERRSKHRKSKRSKRDREDEEGGSPGEA